MSPERRPRVVIDTNVVFSGLYSRSGPPFEILHRWHARQFQLIATPALNLEYHRVIDEARSDPRITLSGFDYKLFARLLAIEARWFDGKVSLLIQSRDTKDNMLLEGAVGGHASYLVTGDSDLLILRSDPRLAPLSIVRPQEFLRALDTSA